MRHKTILLLIIVIGIFVLFAVWAYYKFPKFMPEFKLNNNNCPEGIIPEKIKLDEFATSRDSFLKVGDEIHTIGYGAPYHLLETKYWKDSVIIEYSLVPNYGDACKKGNSEGENINNVYCNGLLHKGVLKDIDTEGNIKRVENRNYKITLELKPLGSIGNFIDNGYINISSANGEVSFEGEGDIHIYLNYSVISANCIKL